MKLKVEKLVLPVTVSSTKHPYLPATPTSNSATILFLDAAKRLVVVGTASDFRYKVEIDAAVKQLKSLGVDVIGVAFGVNVDTLTIRKISSFPTTDNFKIASTITDLISRLPRSIVALSCKSKCDFRLEMTFVQIIRQILELFVFFLIIHMFTCHSS